MVFSQPRWTVKVYEDLNFFQRLIYRYHSKKNISKECKKDFDFTQFRLNNPRPDISFNDYLKENF